MQYFDFVLRFKYTNTLVCFTMILDVQKSECLSSWASHKGEVYSLLFSPDETSCYSMGSDGKVRTRPENYRGLGTQLYFPA